MNTRKAEKEIKKQADSISNIFRQVFCELDELDSSKVSDKSPPSHQRLSHVTANIRDLIRAQLLSEKNPNIRLNQAEFWVKVMEECFKQKNFLAVDCIRSALTAPDIMRLSAYLNLSDGAKNFLTFLEDFFAKAPTTLNYMRQLDVNDSVPALSAYKGILDKADEKLKSELASELQEIQQTQRQRIEPNPTFNIKIGKVKFHTEINDLAKPNSQAKSDKEFYSDSLLIEPRGSHFKLKNKTSYQYNHYDIHALSSIKQQKTLAADDILKQEKHASESVSTDEKLNHVLKKIDERIRNGDPCQNEIMEIMQNHSKNQYVYALFKKSMIMMSNQLRHIDMEAFLNFNTRELYYSDIEKTDTVLLAKGETGKGILTAEKTMRELNQHTNQVQSFVENHILKYSDLHARTAAIEYWIRVAHTLISHEPYDLIGAMQIYAALNTAHITRLTFTFEGITEEAKIALEELTNLFNPEKNNKNYKDFIHQHNQSSIILNPVFFNKEAFALHDIIHKENLDEQLKTISDKMLDNTLSTESKNALKSEYESILAKQKQINQLELEQEKLKNELTLLSHNQDKDQLKINEIYSKIEEIKAKINCLFDENYSQKMDAMCAEIQSQQKHNNAFIQRQNNPIVFDSLKKQIQQSKKDDIAHYNRSLELQKRGAEPEKNKMAGRMRSDARTQIKNAIKRIRDRITSNNKHDASTIQTPAQNRKTDSTLETTLINKIGDYGLGKNIDQEVKNTLGDKSYKILHHDSVEHSPTAAREAFIHYLITVLQSTSNDSQTANAQDPLDNIIKLENFLGKQGIELYLKAVEEEKNSAEFRNAVFLKAKREIPGNKWENRLLLWVAGPSASGKSFSSAAVLDQLNTEMKSHPNDHSGNTIIAIDGGIEREMSQMRQLVLQSALTKGYSGIKDLHKKTHLDIKYKIKKATLQNPNLSLIIPDTFSNPMAILKIYEYDNLPNTTQVFSEIIADHNKDDAFKATIEINGNSRAFKKNAAVAPIEERNITMNNLKIGCESKKYQSKFFIHGKKGSEIARKKYLAVSKTKLYIPIVNDFIFVKKENDRWIECNSNESNTINLSKRDFDAFLNHKKDHSASQIDLPEWLQERKNKNIFQPPIIHLKKKQTHASHQNTTEQMTESNILDTQSASSNKTESDENALQKSAYDKQLDYQEQIHFLVNQVNQLQTTNQSLKDSITNATQDHEKLSQDLNLTRKKLLDLIHKQERVLDLKSRNLEAQEKLLALATPQTQDTILNSINKYQDQNIQLDATFNRLELQIKQHESLESKLEQALKNLPALNQLDLTSTLDSIEQNEIKLKNLSDQIHHLEQKQDQLFETELTDLDKELNKLNAAWDLPLEDKNDLNNAIDALEKLSEELQEMEQDLNEELESQNQISIPNDAHSVAKIEQHLFRKDAVRNLHAMKSHLEKASDEESATPEKTQSPLENIQPAETKPINPDSDDHANAPRLK